MSTTIVQYIIKKYWNNLEIILNRERKETLEFEEVFGPRLFHSLYATHLWVRRESTGSSQDTMALYVYMHPVRDQGGTLLNVDQTAEWKTPSWDLVLRGLLENRLFTRNTVL
jgi:hypothetical protein